MLKDLIRGSFLLKISNSPCAVLHHSFTDRYLKWAHASTSTTISGPNPVGSQPPIWPHLCKEPLWLIFGFCCWLFFFHAYLNDRQGNYLDLRQALRAQCHSMQWWGGGKWGGAGEQTQKGLNDMIWAGSRLASTALCEQRPVFILSCSDAEKSPFMGKSVSKGWADVKRKVFYCFVCLFTPFILLDLTHSSTASPSKVL